MLGMPLDGRSGITAGGELDNYLRYLQTTGVTPLTPWSLRQFSPRVTAQLLRESSAHPWQRAAAFSDTSTRDVSLLPATVGIRYNSAYPFGGNDGAVWAGRGATFSAQGGFAVRLGPVSAVFDPIFFSALNQPFSLQPNGQTGRLSFADGDFPTIVDRPQRFGDGAYTKLDPGQSTIRVDVAAVGVGVTTANQWWGPATTFPPLLGNNAAGVPHIFVGTNHPVGIGIGTVQTQLTYGLETQSDWSPVSGPRTFTSVGEPGRDRFMSGIIVTFSPGAIKGLELGGARYFHEAWVGHLTRSYLTTPLEGLLKASLPSEAAVPGVEGRDGLKNQLASVFFRWVAPASGFEMYSEYAHEDHNYDMRDLEEEVDHSRLAMLGMRKVFQRAPDRFGAFRAEVLDAYAPTLQRHRGQGLIYVHSPLLQGHTEDGQVLGANIGVGSMGGATIAWDDYTPGGRLTVFALRTSQNNFSDFYTSGNVFLRGTDMSGAVGVESLRLRSWGAISTVLSTNYRGGRARANAARGLNLNAQIGITVNPPR
jgi:hypothetical protein